MAAAAEFLAGPLPAPSDVQGGASDLTIDGVPLLGSIGWEAVELVTGISWHSMPRGIWRFGSGENETVSNAHHLAVEAAESQLADQCQRAGGHGVVGVRLEVKTERHHVTVEFVGTAVRPVGAGQLEDRPFTSGLSARDFVALARAGWRPVGLAVGVSFVFVPWRRRTGRLRVATGNFELENDTTALYGARGQAMERMQSAALARGGSGIIGTNIAEGPVAFARHALGFLATGTATRLDADAHLPGRPTLILPLDDAEPEFEAVSLRET